MINERRRFMRYRLKGNVFAALMAPTVIVGQIKDLSMGGAAFEFIPDTFEEGRHACQHMLDIFLLGSTERLSSMPCTVFMRESGRELSHGGFPTIISQICVAEFNDLPKAQARALVDFLMRYSVGYAASPQQGTAVE